jgi:DHA1 family tetracycline resistance protein-like MFS transporter
VITRARAAFAFIFITVLLDMISFGVIIPVFPQLILQLQGGDMAGAAAIFGLFGTAFALMQLLFSPVQGALSDRFGRRPVILASNLGLGADYVIMALAPSLPLLFVGRLISGITTASFTTAYAYVADVTAPGKRAARFGLMGVAFGIGFIIGPAVGGFLGAIDLHAPFWFSAALSFANFLYGLLILPESLPPERRSRFHLRGANPIGAIRFLGTRPVLVSLALVFLFANLAHDSLPNAFVLYSTARFAFDERAIGLGLTVAGASSLIVQGLVVGRAVAALGERGALVAGLLIGMAGQLLLGLAPTPALFLLGLPVWSFFGISGAALQSLASREVEPSEQGRLQGSLGALRGVVTLITPGLYTGTFALFIGPLAGLGLPGAPFVLSALLLATATVVMLARESRSPAPVRPS